MSTFRKMLFAQRIRKVSGGGGGGGSPIITAGLILYFKFDEGTGTIVNDVSSTALNGTLSGSAIPTWAAGKIGPGSLKFNGSGSSTNSIVITNTDTIVQPNNGDFTMAMWVKCAPFNDHRVLGGKYNGSTGVYYFFEIQANSGASVWSVQGEHGSPSNIIDGTQDITDGNWHHLLGTYVNSTGQAELFVDGVSKGTSAFSTGAVDPNVPVVLGTLGNLNILCYDGYMDEVCAYNRVLTNSEILQLANQT